MVNPERPTTPDSIAVHHILDAHVADPAVWCLDALAAQRTGFDSADAHPAVPAAHHGSVFGSRP